MKKNNDIPQGNNRQTKDNAGTTKKHSSALAAAAKGRSATASVKPSATDDVNGASGTRNTGTNVSYEGKE